MTTPPRVLPRGLKPFIRVWPFIRTEVPLLALGILIALIASALALSIPLILEYLVDGPLREGDSQAVWTATGIIAGLGLLEALFIYLRRVTVVTPGTRIDARLRNALYSHLQDLPVDFHDRWHSGQLLSRAQTDVSLVRRWLSFGLILLVANTITIGLGVAVLFSWSPLLGLTFVITALPMLIFGSRFRRRFQDISRAAQDQWGDVATEVEESVHGIRIVKSFGRSREVAQSFDDSVGSARRLEVAKGRVMALLGFWLGWIPDFSLALCLMVGVWLASVGQLTTGELFAFFATAAVLAPPIASFSFLLALTIDARNGLDRIFEVLDVTPSIISSTKPKFELKRTGSLHFDNVHFRYSDAPTHEPDLLRGVSLELRPGETVALVGAIGSGKTTLAALAARLFDVTSGRVLVDGVDVREFDLPNLRTRVAMAFEDATLFSASVRSNVLLGRHDLDDAPRELWEPELKQALEIADAGFVYDLPDGIDTVIGEQGLSLSGGQRQRLALARAVATTPEILILDDPLSAVDVETEARVEKALRLALRKTTVLIIAQRPSTVGLADRVAVLDQGVIAAVGTHTELLAKSPRYRHLMSSPGQFDGPVSDPENPATVEVGVNSRGESAP